MSYSFNVRARSKTEVMAKVSGELEKMVLAQPIHSADRELAEMTASSFVNLLPNDPNHDTVVSVSGSIWKNEDGIRQASVSVNVHFDKPS